MAILINLFEGIFKKKIQKSNLVELFPEVGFFDKNQKNELEKILGFKISEVRYYEQAFSHRSILRENDIASSNQRLEYLGDAILGMLIGEYLFSTLPKGQEGDLTKMRSAFVKNTTLAKCAKSLNLDQFLKIGQHAEKHLKKGFDSIMSDVMEALIASIYFDRGIEKTKEFVHNKMLPIMKNFKDQINKNYKSSLLEKYQALEKISPTYEVLKESGPDHNKEFLVGVYVNNSQIGQGQGKSKKSAEQDAAKNALEKVVSN
ncbi:ribonuclease III [Candidatus Kapabacteria bacterium]|nr:ribonuclease III [Candidatus Kapabacteria bacterium]